MKTPAKPGVPSAFVDEVTVPSPEVTVRTPGLAPEVTVRSPEGPWSQQKTESLPVVTTSATATIASGPPGLGDIAEVLSRHRPELVKLLVQLESNARVVAQEQMRGELVRQREDWAQLVGRFDAVERQIATARTDLENRWEKSQVDYTRVNEERQRLKGELETALASRDRLEARVAQVEATIAQTMIPLRQALDAARTRQILLEQELDKARRDIHGLNLLLGRKD